MNALPKDVAPRAHARAARVVLLIVFVDMLASSTAIPVLPRLLLDLTHGSKIEAARLVGLFGTAFAAMQFLFGPVQGGLSDRFGRKPVLVVSCLGLCVAQALVALAGSTGTLFAARLLSGISAASISTATAYLADILPAAERAGAFGRVGAAFGMGLVLGPVLGGTLGSVGLRLPFWTASAIAAANAAWASFALVESLPAARRSTFRLASANPLGALAFLATDRRLLGLSLAGFLSMLAQQALISVFVLSATVRFGWSTSVVGLAMATVGLCYALVSTLLVGAAIRRIGERGALIAGQVFGVAGFAMLALAPDGWVFACAIPLIALWGLASPATQSAMARIVPADAQGRLQGAGTSIGGLAGVIGPSLFGSSLAFGLAAHGALHQPGIPFAIAALLLLCGAPLTLRATRV